MPPTETTTFPLVAPAGTGATMRVLDQLVVRAATPLNSSKLDLVPTVGPKFVPFTLTTVPMGPALGLTPLMFGGGVTVKGRPLLGVPPTVTITFPVVAPAGTDVSMLVSLQEVVVVTGVPLKVIVLDPRVAPKVEPVIVMLAPIGPCVRLRVERLGPRTGVAVATFEYELKLVPSVA